jgi:hypothetical protein
MTEVEDRLRAALGRRAEQAPPGTTLLHQVQATHGRRRRRRLAALTGGLAAVAVAISVPVVPRIIGPSGSDLAVAAAAPSAAGVSLVPDDPYTATFPLIPGPSLAALGPPAVMLVGAVPTLSYRNGTFTIAAPSARPFNNASEPAGSTKHPVHGQQARLTQTSDAGVTRQTLTWQESATQWVQITAAPALRTDTLLRYAGGLSVGPVPLTRPYTFALVPGGFTVDNVTPTVVTFCPPGVDQDARFGGKIAVMLAAPASPATPLPGHRVDVGGRPGWLSRTGDTLLQVPLADGDILQIQAPASDLISQADLLRFAAGIQPTAAAEVSLG